MKGTRAEYNRRVKAISLISKAPLSPPVTSVLERRAYQAAHEILRIVDYGEKDLACPGGIRSRRVDRIAQAIVESFSGVSVIPAIPEE